jgi:hypothetical protein
MSLVVADGLVRVSGRPAPPRRLRVGKGRPFAPEVVAEIRALVEGSVLPQRQIAARIGVTQGGLQHIIARHGWRRPPGAPVATDAVGAARALAPLQVRGLAARAAALAESWAAADPGDGAMAALRARARRAAGKMGRRGVPVSALPGRDAGPAPGA